MALCLVMFEQGCVQFILTIKVLKKAPCISADGGSTGKPFEKILDIFIICSIRVFTGK